MMGKPVIVVGAGFIGSAVTDHLRGAGVDVVLVDRDRRPPAHDDPPIAFESAWEGMPDLFVEESRRYLLACDAKKSRAMGYWWGERAAMFLTTPDRKLDVDKADGPMVLCVGGMTDHLLIASSLTPTAAMAASNVTQWRDGNLDAPVFDDDHVAVPTGHGRFVVATRTSRAKEEGPLPGSPMELFAKKADPASRMIRQCVRPGLMVTGPFFAQVAPSVWVCAAPWQHQLAVAGGLADMARRAILGD